MKTLVSKILILSLLLGGTPISFGSSDEKESSMCKSPDELRPKYRKDASGSAKISSFCPSGGSTASKRCFATLSKVETLYNEFKKTYDENCKKIEKSVVQISALDGVSSLDAHNKVIGLSGEGEGFFDAIAEKVDEVVRTALNKSKDHSDPLRNYTKTPGHGFAPAVKNYLDSVVTAQTNAMSDAKNLNKSPASTISTSTSENLGTGTTNPPALADAKKDAVAAAQTFEFVRNLIKAKEEALNARANFSKIKADNITARDNLGGNNGNDGSNGTDDGSGNDGGGLFSGFKPTDLLALAPLAGMLMQKPPTPPAQDPFQSGIGANAPPAPLPTAKLNPKTTGGESKTPTPETPSAESPSAPDASSPYADAFTGEEESPSDITKGSLGSANGSGNGVSTASSSGLNGGSGSSESGGDGKSRVPATSAATEEALQGFSGGGGIGYGGGSGNSSSTPPESIADPMKDLLTDPDSLGGDSFDTNLNDSSEHAQAAGDVLLEDSESLFPRVRACHVRALKKGWVLHGLGEKLSEIDE